jgi:hypothetical protein
LKLMTSGGLSHTTCSRPQTSIPRAPVTIIFFTTEVPSM